MLTIGIGVHMKLVRSVMHKIAACRHKLREEAGARLGGRRTVGSDHFVDLFYLCHNKEMELSRIEKLTQVLWYGLYGIPMACLCIGGLLFFELIDPSMAVKPAFFLIATFIWTAVNFGMVSKWDMKTVPFEEGQGGRS